MHLISFPMEKSSAKIKDIRNKKERERKKRKKEGWAVITTLNPHGHHMPQ